MQREHGLMVLRVWTEPGSTQPLRVEVRQTHDPSRGFRPTFTLTDVGAVLDAVRAFLEAGQAIGAAGTNGDA